MLLRFLFAAVFASLSLTAVAAPVPGVGKGLPEKSPAVCFGLSISSIQGGVVKTVSESLQDGPITPLLSEGVLHGPADGRSEGSSRSLRGWAYGATLDRLHWRVAHHQFWAECDSLCFKIPTEDLPLLAVSDREKGPLELRKKYRDEHADSAAWFTTIIIGAANETLATIANQHAGGSGSGIPGDAWQWDFLPTGPKTWDLFMLRDSSMTVWRSYQKPEREGILGTLGVGGEQHGEPFVVGFQEPFFVYGKPESPFFVTKSGKVFQLRRPEGKEPRVEKVWDDNKRPVTTILNDADTGRTFVAGRDLPEGPDKWFYFELTEKIERKPFDRSAVTSTAEEPLKSALLFARFLAKEGLVKDKPR